MNRDEHFLQVTERVSSDEDDISTSIQQQAPFLGNFGLCTHHWSDAGCASDIEQIKKIQNSCRCWRNTRPDYLYSQKARNLNMDNVIITPCQTAYSPRLCSRGGDQYCIGVNCWPHSWQCHNKRLDASFKLLVVRQHWFRSYTVRMIIQLPIVCKKKCTLQESSSLDCFFF